jgi:hypothetical protein
MSLTIFTILDPPLSPVIAVSRKWPQIRLYDYIPERKKVQGIFRPRREAAGKTGAARREDRHILKKDGAGRFTSR